MKKAEKILADSRGVTAVLQRTARLSAYCISTVFRETAEVICD